jgi:hypothetical protein
MRNAPKALSEFAGIHAQKDVPKGIMRKNSMWKRQKGAKPFLSKLVEFFHIIPPLSSEDCGSKGNSNNINQQVYFVFG